MEPPSAAAKAEDSGQAVLLPEARPLYVDATMYALPEDHVLCKLLHSAPASNAAGQKTLGKHAVEDNALQTGEKGTACAISKMKLMMSKLREDADSLSHLSQIVSELSTQFDQHRQATLKVEKEMLHWTTKFSSFKDANRTYQFHFKRAKACLRQMTEVQQVGINRQGYIVAHKLSTRLAPRIEKLMADEFKKSVAPAISKLVDSTKHEIKMKTNNTETVIQTSISDAIKSKAMADTLTRAINPLLRTEANAVCREVLQNNLMRKIDLVCQNIFSQLSKAFQLGVKEILQQLQKYIEKGCQSYAKKALKNIESNLDTSLQTFFSDHKADLVTPDMQAQLDKAVKKTVGTLKSDVLEALAAHQKYLVDNLTEEMYGAVKEAVGAAVSGRMESCCNVNARMLFDPNLVLPEIAFLVHQGQYNMAFLQALSAADPSLVVSTCEMVCPTIAIGKNPCPLEQPVLLLLIEKLCDNLATKTALKIKYLEEAVLSLDEGATASQSCKNAVLMRLLSKIEELLKDSSTHDMERVAKRLYLIVQSSLGC